MRYKHLKDLKNFKISEFHCKCKNAGCIKVLDKKEVQEHFARLQMMRDFCNRPMRVNSGYRCEKHNASVGGVKGSQHVQGVATDIAIPADIRSAPISRQQEWMRNMTKKWFELCAKDGVGGAVGWYDTFMHFDSRKVKTQFDYQKSYKGKRKMI